MANDTLLALLKLNIVGAAAILLVIALRRPMRAWFGARTAYALWATVAAAMLAVMLPERTVEVMPDAPSVTAASAPALDVEARLAAGGQTVDWASAGVAIWLTGAVVMLGLLAWRQQAFVASLGRLRHEPGDRRTMRAEATGMGPAILGAIWPKLILPQDFETRFDAAERELVLAHERVHLDGGDARINGLVALAQSVFWFNPLAHVAAHLMRIDQELACDAAVAAQYPRAKRTYAGAMLKTQIAPIGLPLGCYWPAKGEHPLKLRIAMLKRGLPGEMRAAWGVMAVALACLASGCVVWVGQPAREVVEARSDYRAPVLPEQAKQDARLLRAVWIGRTGLAEAALASGANVNARNNDGLTGLVVAARKEDMQLLNLLLDHGADVNLASAGEGSALITAARRGHIHAVTALVEHGADINAFPPSFGTPLAAAARAQQFEVVKYLVEQGADVNLASTLPIPWNFFWSGAHTPLEFAINSGDSRTIAYLKSKGAKM